MLTYSIFCRIIHMKITWRVTGQKNERQVYEMQRCAIKKLWAMCVLSAVALFVVTGCNNNGNNVPAPVEMEDVQPEQNQPVVDEPTVDVETAVNEPEATQLEQVNPFDAFANGLEQLGLSFETNWTAAQLVGAENGYRYILADGRIELYEFDASSEAFALAVANQAVTLEGFGNFPAVVAGNMAMMIDDMPAYDEIVALFVSLFE